jgi:hypothetical protein
VSSMRAQQSFVSELGARFSVGVGCPSFGGQRTDRGGSSRLRTGLVSKLEPSRPGLAESNQLRATAGVAVLGKESQPGHGRRTESAGGETTLQGRAQLEVPNA